MNVYEVVTLLGLFVGPVVAVLITLWSQQRSAKRDRQSNTLRLLLNTRHLPADPGYSVAINMIPVEFNDVPGVMTAWTRYIEIVRYAPSDENRDRHQQEMATRQTQLIFQLSQHLGYRLSETEIQMSAYASQGFVDREQLNIQAQVAWVRIANALEGQNVAAGLPSPPDPADLIPAQSPALPEQAPGSSDQKN